MEPWTIEAVIDKMAKYEQPVEMNMDVIINQEKQVANAQQNIDNKARKQVTSKKGSKRKSAPP